jgi:hypothetical protein
MTTWKCHISSQPLRGDYGHEEEGSGFTMDVEGKHDKCGSPYGAFWRDYSIGG